MKKYDIGILTFWNVPNYGTFAQAYALQKVIQSLCPNKNVRQIAHLDEKHFDFYFNHKRYLRSYPIWKKAFWKSFLVTNADTNGKKKIFFDAYDKIPHTDAINRKNVIDFSFDKIFLGSDILWDFSVEPFNHDSMLFGQQFEASEINSYAASFGTVRLDMEVPSYVQSSIKKMKHILVRDENSAEIVKSINGRKPEVVLDPVWLWNFQDDRDIPEPVEKNYILVYGQDFTEGFINNLVKYAKKNNQKIIALDCNEDNYTWCDKLIKQDELDPLLWIGYFKHAAAVATSTFHGMTFALLFNKKIAFCKTDFIIAKIGAFLEELEILDLFDDKDDAGKMLNYDWNYSYINNVIQQKKEKSMELLKEACK